MAAATGATLLLVRVQPLLLETLAVYSSGLQPLAIDASGADLSRWDEEGVAAARMYLEEIRGRLPAAILAEPLVLCGKPGPALTDFALDEHVDLTVMSTHARAGLPRMLLGSTADRLVRSGAPVLLIHPPTPSSVVSPEPEGSGVSRDAVAVA
ncbi:MAG: universal stress protein [Dehalococcoidia bacterium]